MRDIDSPPPGFEVMAGARVMTEFLCVEPAVLDGNFSDKTSDNKWLTRIGRIMKRHGFGIGAFGKF